MVIHLAFQYWKYIQLEFQFSVKVVCTDGWDLRTCRTLSNFSFLFELCLINRLGILQFDWKIQSLRITHDSLQSFHGHRKSKSIYLKKCGGMKFVNVTACPSRLYKHNITNSVKPIFLFQNYELTLASGFASRQSSLHHLLPQSSDVTRPRHIADSLAKQ